MSIFKALSESHSVQIFETVILNRSCDFQDKEARVLLLNFIQEAKSLKVLGIENNNKVSVEIEYSFGG